MSAPPSYPLVVLLHTDRDQQVYGRVHLTPAVAADLLKLRAVVTAGYQASDTFICAEFSDALEFEVGDVSGVDPDASTEGWGLLPAEPGVGASIPPTFHTDEQTELRTRVVMLPGVSWSARSAVTGREYESVPLGWAVIETVALSLPVEFPTLAHAPAATAVPTGDEDFDDELFDPGAE